MRKAKVIKKHHELYGQTIDVVYDEKNEKWYHRAGLVTYLFTEDCLEFEDMPAERDSFADVCADMVLLHAKKDKDYGGAFDKSMDEFGLSAAAIRLTDKLNRFKNLIKQDAEVKDESIEDTLLDAACYAVMGLVWLRKHKKA